VNDQPRPVVTPRPAASVVLLRDTPGGPEILYVRRSADLKFMGGYWVFPGGRIDPGDHRPGGEADELAAARQAAAREAFEEAGVAVDPAALHPVCQWTTPATSPIRFATWFFAAAADPDSVRVDGVEIQDHRWWRPPDALQAHRDQRIQFANPTFALSTRLSGHATVAEALAAVDAWPRESLLGRLHPTDGGRVALYAEDCGYETGDLDCSGPRHRIWMLDGGWRYERDFQTP
jgi:8-oxo-dGTP pyrophosphatase MutT (NUDIX family)